MQYTSTDSGSPVNWGSDITALADALLEQLAAAGRSGNDPMKKICVVVNSPATERWLKQYFLLDRRTSQLLFNLEFVKLPEFVNDWLWAVVEGRAPRERRATRHPYSKDVMTWRIYRLLGQMRSGEGFDELLDYIDGDARRRSALAEKLAILYDDYLNYRFRMLRGWETDNASECDVPKWQIALYKKLVAENANTYAAQYEFALRKDPDGSRRAYACGFPEYLAVHIFDIPFIPEPTLMMLEKISKTVPMRFWVFNPMDDWLAESPSRREITGKLRRKLRQKIAKNFEDHAKLVAGETAAEGSGLDINDFDYPSEEERLLGVMAAGARGVIGALCRDYDGNVEVVTKRGRCSESSRSGAMDLEDVSISVHGVYSPRRELEAIKDGLHEFFRTHADAAPHDALVLCADWENYAPIIDMVFPPYSGAGAPPAGYIPVATENLPGGSLVSQSFAELLKFRSNRFEISAVFSLLNVPDIRARRGLDEDAVDVLRRMVKSANIHWGADDGDVRSILGIPPAADGGNDKNPFTWRRGLDRLTAELLHGFDTDGVLKDAGGSVGEVHPCGHVEGARADHVAALWSLIGDLVKLRREKLPEVGRGGIDDLRRALLWVLETFYAENDGNRVVLADMRKAAAAVAENLRNAGIDEIDYDVFVDAVLNSANGYVGGRRSRADSVWFAPLNCYTAMPHKFVWICGLNDGVFPRIGGRAAYDAIGRHPDLFDVPLREQDAFALLKATLCAMRGGQLSFSYVGRSVRNNQHVPPSVLLENLTDYFRRRDIGFTRYEHPLTGYSRRCFESGKGALPPAYSGIYLDTAKRLAAPEGNASAETRCFSAFPVADGRAEIALDDLAAFFAGPHNYLFKRRLDAALLWLERFDDCECLETKLDKKLKRKLALEEETEEKRIVDAKLSVETGNAPDPESAERAIRDFKGYARSIVTCLGDDGNAPNLAETYKRFLTIPERDGAVDLRVGAVDVRITLRSRTIELRTKGGPSLHTFLFADYLDKNSDSSMNGFRIRHLAVNALIGDVTTVAFSPDAGPYCGSPLPRELAVEKLTGLLGMALEDLPAEYPDFRKAGRSDRYDFRTSEQNKDALPKEWQNKDALPKEWQSALSDAVTVI